METTLSDEISQTLFWSVGGREGRLGQNFLNLKRMDCVVDHLIVLGQNPNLETYFSRTLSYVTSCFLLFYLSRDCAPSQATHSIPTDWVGRNLVISVILRSKRKLWYQG